MSTQKMSCCVPCFLASVEWLALLLAMTLFGHNSTVAATPCDSLLIGALRVYRVGEDPTKMTIADFDEVGGRDLAVLNYSGRSLSVLLNDGKGGFGNRTDYHFDAYPSDIASGDLNGDSMPDIAIIFLAKRSVLFMMNVGDGQLGDSVSIFVDSVYAPYAIQVADLDGLDGPDLALAVQNRGLMIFLNDGYGSFPTALISGDGAMSGGFAIGEFDGVNGSDLIYGKWNELGILLNNGNGTFSAPLVVPLSGYPIEIGLADLDGYPGGDIVALTSTVNVLYNNGDSTLFSPLQFNAGGGPTTLDLGRADEDQLTDVIVCNANERKGYILLNNGFGGLHSPYSFSTGEQVSDIGASDFDADGKTDFAMTLERPDNVTLLRNLGSGQFDIPPADYVWGYSLYPSEACVLDFDNDGLSDFIVAASNQNSLLYRNIGNGKFQSYAQLFQCKTVATADFDLVHGQDLLQGDNSGARVWFNAGSGLGGYKNVIANEDVFDATAGLMDSDSLPDIAFINSSTNDVAVYKNIGDSSFSLLGHYPAGQTPYKLVMGEFDRTDGPDLVVLNGGNGLSVLLNNGTGALEPPITYAAGTNPSGIAVGDLDSKLGDDLVIAHQANGGRLSVRFGNGNGTFQHPVNISIPGTLKDVWIGNIDGANGPDIAVTTLTNDRVAVLLNNGDGTFGSPIDYGAGWKPDVITGGDLDGIGGDDLIISNRQSYNSTIILNSTTPCCSCPNHADPVADGVTDIFDVVRAVEIVFRGGNVQYDPGCPGEIGGRTDVNCSGESDILDIVSLIDVAFRSADPDIRFCTPCGS